MEFCEQCHFMLYTKLEDKNKNSEGEVHGEEDLKLMNYCKNCGFEKERDDTNDSIYERNYQKNFIADKLLSNKYTIYDRTLPRLKSDCVNTKCITNLKIDLNKSFMVDNLPEISEEINEIFQDDDDKIERKIPMKLTSMLIILKDEDDLEGLKEKYNGLQHSTGEKLRTHNEMKIEKEVLYIKYDPENMKYLYMCVNCGTSWFGTSRKG